jgi:hypothetical protein
VKVDLVLYNLPLFSSQTYSVNTLNLVSDLATITAQNFLQLNLGSTLLSLVLPLLMLCSGLLKLARGRSRLEGKAQGAEREEGGFVS